MGTIFLPGTDGPALWYPEDYDRLNEEAQKYLDYQSKIIEQECALANMKSSEQNADAMKKAYEDVAKVMTVARRLMKGDIVPASDEMKLQEYDDKLFLPIRQKFPHELWNQNIPNQVLDEP